jgi:GNAT superfamily N-acetyltransferase
MHVIKATPAHLHALVPLFEAYRAFYQMPPDAPSAKAFIEARIQAHESVIFLVLDDAGTPVGFTQLYPLFSSTRLGKLWLLNDLYVSDAARGQGYSKALLNRAKQLARETGAIALQLQTAKTNTIGNRLYSQEGFLLDADYNTYEWAVVAR